MRNIEDRVITLNKNQLVVRIIQTRDDKLITKEIADEGRLSLEQCAGAFDVPVQKPVYVETPEDADKYAGSPDWEVIYITTNQHKT